jgi:NAD(P)-dependent dehydrogenase (short-subunit alcohol dehydrogenase family)
MTTILITGANRGLGLEFAKQYLEKGDTVIATCRSPERADGLQELQSIYPDALTILQLDVTSEDGRNATFDMVENTHRSIDILINNAGIISGDGKSSSVLGRVFKEDFMKVIQVNTLAPLLMSEKFLPLLEKGSKPKIVSISSLNGSIAKRTVGGKYSYATSKAALNMVMKILSNDLRQKGITTVALHPGWIKTDMGGEEAPLEKEGPITEMIDLVDGISLSDSGKFLDREGNELPW